MTGHQIRLAEPDDAEAIYQMVSTEMMNAVSQYTTAGQRGYRNYLQDILDAQGSNPSQKLLVGELEGAITTFLDLRVKDHKSIFLSRICVDHRHRGLGLGTNVLLRINRCLGGRPRWALDVFDFNHGALRLYSRLGLVETSSSLWLLRDLPARSGFLQIVDQSAVRARYERYGFSPFRVVGYPDIDFSLIGDAVRVPTVQHLNDADLLGALRAEFPHIRVAIAVHQGGTDHPDARASNMFARSVRMEGQIALRD